MARDRRRGPKQETWPKWRYGPNGQKGLFQSAEDVPEGWSSKPTEDYSVERKPKPDKRAIIYELRQLDVVIDPRWGLAKLQEVLNDNRPAG